MALGKVGHPSTGLSFTKYLLSSYYVPDPVTGTKVTAVKEANKILFSRKLV